MHHRVIHRSPAGSESVILVTFSRDIGNRRRADLKTLIQSVYSNAALPSPARKSAPGGACSVEVSSSERLFEKQ
jgi:hypothetical protein